ncbi:MAG: NAD(P)-binding domain-containing protein [Candidatus Dormibacteria bacterium]
MRIGIIGSGRIGGTLAGLLTRAGHDVWLANSRGPASLAGTVAELGAHAHAATAEQAAEQGEVVIVSIPLGNYRDIPAAPLAGKVVVDTNNYYPDRDGQFPELDERRTTSSELLARHLAGARVVKAFNTIYFMQLREDGRPAAAPARRALPIAGDDAEAKQIVTRLLDEIGFDAVDLGPLREGHRQQPGSAIYNIPQTAAQLREALAG